MTLCVCLTLTLQLLGYRNWGEAKPVISSGTSCNHNWAGHRAVCKACYFTADPRSDAVTTPNKGGHDTGKIPPPPPKKKKKKVYITYSPSRHSKSTWLSFLYGTKKEMFRRMFTLLVSIQWKWMWISCQAPKKRPNKCCFYFYIFCFHVNFKVLAILLSIFDIFISLFLNVYLVFIHFISVLVILVHQ